MLELRIMGRVLFLAVFAAAGIGGLGCSGCGDQLDPCGFIENLRVVVTDARTGALVHDATVIAARVPPRGEGETERFQLYGGVDFYEESGKFLGTYEISVEANGYAPGSGTAHFTRCGQAELVPISLQPLQSE